MTDSTTDQEAITQHHRDCLQDSVGDAYTQFHGWAFSCLWCEFVSTGKTLTVIYIALFGGTITSNQGAAATGLGFLALFTTMFASFAWSDV